MNLTHELQYLVNLLCVSGGNINLIFNIRCKLLGSESSFNIDKFFDDFLKGPTIFRSRNTLDASFIPDILPHRDEQIREVAEIMACTLKSCNPSNLFIYGKTGTGKTAVIKHVSEKLNQKCSQIGINPAKWIYINCNQVTTGYRVIATICNRIDPENKVPPTGLPRDVLIESLFNKLNDKCKDSICFIILDEIDKLKDKSSKDSVLYLLSRINEDLQSNTKVNLIGISNVLNFKDELDARVCSSLSEEEILFPAYNALELYDILRMRAEIALKFGVVEEGALRLCSAIAARENGDARRALSLLRKSTELVERRSLDKLTEEIVYLAQDQIDRDKTTTFIQDLPVQQKAVLLSIYLNHKFRRGSHTKTGEIYSTYCELQKMSIGLNQLTSRRVTDLIKDLDLAGITESKVMSFGRKGGRTRVVALKANESQIIKSYNDDMRWSEFLNYKPQHIRRDVSLYSGRKYRSIL